MQANSFASAVKSGVNSSVNSSAAARPQDTAGGATFAGAVKSGGNGSTGARPQDSNTAGAADYQAASPPGAYATCSSAAAVAAPPDPLWAEADLELGFTQLMQVQIHRNKETKP